MEDRVKESKKNWREQARGKVAVCPSCNKWFSTYQDRNAHRASCPKRNKPKKENA